MEVTKTMLGLVMTPEQREQFVKDYREELAKKHVLQRQERKLNAAINENRKKLAGLELLTGGLDIGERFTTTGLYLEINAYLNENYTPPFPVDARETGRQFVLNMRNKRPYTEADMDKYAVNLVELIEFSYHGDPDAASFWLWAIYGGDYKLMIDREAEGLGFKKKKEEEEEEED